MNLESLFFLKKDLPYVCYGLKNSFGLLRRKDFPKAFNETKSFGTLFMEEGYSFLKKAHLESLLLVEDQ